jgi:transposase
VSNPDAESPEYLGFLQTIVDAYKAGVPDKDVARIFDVSNTLVRRWRTKQISPLPELLNGTAMRGALGELKTVLERIALEGTSAELLKLSTQFRLTLDSAFQAGMTEKDVAHFFGASLPTVARWIVRANTPHPAIMRAVIPQLEAAIELTKAAKP